MNYQNVCTQSNPGHLIIVIDQNAYMKEFSSSGLTLAQRATYFANRLINELELACFSGSCTKRLTKVTIIGYGGINNDVNVIHDSYIDCLAEDNNISIVTFEYPFCNTTRETRIICELKRFVEPLANGDIKTADAFRKVKTMIIAESTFSKKRNHQLDPVPIIIHISTNLNPHITNEYEEVLKSITDISLPNGNPLIMNCVLTKNDTFRDSYPDTLKGEVNNLEKYFKNSSSIPEAFIPTLHYLGYPNLTTANKAIMINSEDNNTAYVFGVMQLGGSEPNMIRYNG